MKHTVRRLSLLAAAGSFGLVTATAEAHVSFAAGAVPVAGKSYVATLNVPHGCTVGATHLDNERVEVEIPATFTGVRPAHSPLGKAAVTLSDAGAVTRITWTQAAADVQAEDTHFYPLTLRGTLPNAPFTAIEFRTVQYCPGGSSVAWEGADVPKLRILPARTPGWNSYTIPAGVSLTSADVKAFFADALIVWSGSKAYSVNTETTAQIGRTAGVSALVTATATDVVLNPGDAIWVRY